MRRVLCVKVKQRQILPGLPQAYHEQAGSGAHEETARPCYAIRAKIALIYRACSAWKSLRRYRTPFPSKTAFYCVTYQNQHPQKDRAREVITGFPRPVLFLRLFIRALLPCPVPAAFLSAKCYLCSVSETVEPENLNNCCQDIQGRICCIKVLGSGCCHALYENTQSAVKAMGISVEVEYITDLKKVMEYGVMSVPALVVNNKVVSTGKVLKTENVQKLLQKIVSEK